MKRRRRRFTIVASSTLPGYRARAIRQRGEDVYHGLETGTSTVAAADAAGNENVAAEVQVVRLEEHGTNSNQFRCWVISTASHDQVRSAATLQRWKHLWRVSPQGNNDWVALPSWELLEFSTSPFALFCDDTSALDVKGVKDKSEPGLLIADGGGAFPLRKYYLVAKTSSLVLAGSNAAARASPSWTVRISSALEREGTVNTLAHVLLRSRAVSAGTTA